MTASSTSTKLRISEIFLSLQGESSRAGLPTLFVRLTGCPLRCVWCDTAYAFTGGQSMALAEVIDTVDDLARQKVKQVCVTGGEPLAQPACLLLLKTLCDAGYSVSLETSGALDIGGVDSRVSRIVDIKPPASGESDKNHWQNLSLLCSSDEIKFVIADRGDYEWAHALIDEHQLANRCPVLFSPVDGKLPATLLADWILADRLPVRFQLQLHKLLWGNIRGK